MSQSIIGKRTLKTMLDEVSASVFYIGRASEGTATSAAFWQVHRFTDNGAGLLTHEMADGNTNFDNIWDNRTSLTYS